jgi:hypothetical protein
LIFQTIVAIYGGFFGAGMGILTLAALAIQGVDDMQELNGLKNLTSAVNYTVAAATFIIAGAISWPHTLLMIATAMAGACRRGLRAPPAGHLAAAAGGRSGRRSASSISSRPTLDLNLHLKELP